MNTKRFQDKVVLVTGGNSGIGRATAIAFAKEGAKVVIAARRETLGKEVVNEIENTGGEAVFIKTDVTVPGDIENLLKLIVEKFGRLDCAFNNAGTDIPIKRTANATLDDFNTVINTNLKGVWLCMKYELPIMAQQRSGVIVNCSSVAGVRGDEGVSLYSASKHGVLGLTKAAALENAHRNIRVNAVCPGFIRTPMVEHMISQSPQMEENVLTKMPVGRLGKPEEIAGAVLWMCSDAASFMTGKEMVIGGGQAIHS
ncbi:MAG: SDR family oxidoreductase [Deltaproteobacteria bacterium]|nr:SDR family oxidoreductase [Deltaproteobacteria bacterium]